MSDDVKTVGELLQNQFEKAGVPAAPFTEFGFEPHIPAEIGDYIGENGFLMCGKCHTRKECVFKLSGRMVPCMCECRKREWAEKEEAKKREQERDRIRELLSMSLIDELFYRSTFDSFIIRNEKDAKFKNRLCKYADRFEEMYEMNKGLLLYGPPGTGKTFGAYCIANQLINQGVSVFITSVVKLATGFGDELQRTLGIMRNARLLILDDLGAERNTEARAEQVFDVIDSRINSCKPMIITSNITKFKDDDIRRQRVYDRLSKVCIPMFVDGESRRLEDAKANHDRLMAMLDE